MRRIRKVLTVFLVMCFVFGTFSATAEAASYVLRRNRYVSVDGGPLMIVRTLDYSYRNDTYINLRDLALVLADSDKAFSVEIDKEEIRLTPGEVAEGELEGFDVEKNEMGAKANLVRKDLFLREEKLKYYSISATRDDQTLDSYMALVDVAMMLDVDIEVGGDGVLRIDTKEPFFVSGEELLDSDYLIGVNGLVVGDATTGEIYFDYSADEAYAIASTTKLMTYLTFKEAERAGEVSESDVITITAEAQRLSESDDGVTPMREGMKIPAKELITAALIPSSNEAAYSLAVHAAGSEEAFVERMNDLAKDIGMESAEFFNSHGLPSFEDVMLPAKRQNLMSARDMFTMSAYLLNEYPEVLEVTSIKETNLPNLGLEIKNSNGLLYNLPETKGLKTGTTNKSGACLVSCIPMIKDGETHNLVVVLLGAENGVERVRISEICGRYAMKVFEGASGGSTADSLKVMPKDINRVVDRLVKAGLRRQAG